MAATAQDDPRGASAALRRARRRACVVGLLALGAAAYAIVRALGRTRLLGSAADVAVVAGLLGLFVAAALLAAWSAGGTRRLVVRRALLVVAPPLALLALLELPVLLTEWDWRRVVPRPGDDLFLRLKRTRNPWNRDDAELIYTRPPGGTIAGSTYGDCVVWLGAVPDREYRYDLRYDGRGYRNRAALERADVAVVGDSFVEAALLPDAELFTERLSAALGKPVANLGVGGYGPQQELVVLRRHALPLEPRVVYWLFFEGNDLADAARFESDRAEMAALLDQKAGHFMRSLTASLVGLAGCLAAPRQQRDEAKARAQSGTLAIAGPDHGKRLYFPYPAAPLSAVDEQALAKVEGLLREAGAATRAAGAELVVVLVPEKFRIYGDRCDYEADATAATWRTSDLPERMATFAAREGLALLDLAAALRAEAERGELLYFVDDGHWNGAGHAVVARELARDAAARLAAQAAR
ncbi:MAG: SGNH/GDSL hydrolase family protein [Planctomycetes bacterium]|nr:SGNH/GDSL hydrolase family protein [Planctomycetota bacterium]